MLGFSGAAFVVSFLFTGLAFTMEFQNYNESSVEEKEKRGDAARQCLFFAIVFALWAIFFRMI
jgi:hypothetical protein